MLAKEWVRESLLRIGNVVELRREHWTPPLPASVTSQETRGAQVPDISAPRFADEAAIGHLYE